MSVNHHDRVAVVDACRTPFMRSGTAFYDLMAWELGCYAVKGLVVRTGIEPSAVDYVIMGTVMADIATTNVAREIMLGAGLPGTIPAHTCTAACVSANIAVTSACDMIQAGEVDTVIAGGVESLSDPAIKVSKRYRRFILDLTMFKHDTSTFRKNEAASQNETEGLLLFLKNRPSLNIPRVFPWGPMQIDWHAPWHNERKIRMNTPHGRTGWRLRRSRKAS